MNQIHQLSTQLVTGEMGRSIESPRTKVLMQFENDRRQYNRINGENVDLYTYLCLNRRGEYEKVDPVARVLMGVFFHDQEKNKYKRKKRRGGIFSKNVKIK